jgi:hypothetical protein
MAITVKHSKVSTIPDDANTDLVRPSDWNADHTLVGLGTMAEQDANNVNITGGTITGVTGLGDVTGPASSTDNAIARFNGTTGKLIQNSAVIIDDSNNVTGVNTLTTTNLVVNDDATLGGSNADTVAVNGRITTDLEPNADAAKDIGTSGRNWRDGFFSRNLQAEGKVVSPHFDALNSAGGQLRNSGGTPQIQWGAGGGNNVSVDVAININPANSQVDISPTGTGTVRINPATAGTIDNTSIGATTPSTVNATTITGQTARVNGTGQNLVLQSQDFATSWIRSNTTVITNTTVAPDGTTTADTITASAGNSQHDAAFQSVTVLSGFAYTISVFAKAGTNNFLQFCVNGDGAPFANFDLSTGVVGTSSTGTASISSAANGFYRCVFTYTTTLATAYPIIEIVPSSSSTRRPTWNAAGTETIILWGAQLEIGSTANTYIPTTTTAVYGTPTLSFSGVSSIGLLSNGALYLQPAGTGALQAQATTSTTAGGNARGANAVDWQTARTTAAQVASGSFNVISGGRNNTVSGFDSAISGGVSNTTTSERAYIGGGIANSVSGAYSSIVGGRSNTAAGVYNFIGGGFTNSGTANAAVTTQSATMNGTTAVTLSGSNASIRVGQLILGTSIGFDTYVAAISGTSLTLSQAASGSSTSTLSFFTPHGVVVGGGNNQATGSYSFIGGGGDAGTAANRNVASGDWSFVGGGRRNTASGEGSVVCGGGLFGAANTASGSGGFVGGGYQNSASGFGSFIAGGANNTSSSNFASVIGGSSNTANGVNSAILGGNQGSARSITGYQVSSACTIPIANISGVSQAALLILARETTDATPTALCSNTSAAGTTNQVILPNNSAYFFRGEVVSGKTAAGDTKGWTIEGVIKRGANAASTALVGIPTVTSTYADLGAATWDIAVTADTTNGGLRVTFTGQAATTIRTVCQIRTTEMTY